MAAVSIDRAVRIGIDPACPAAFLDGLRSALARAEVTRVVIGLDAVEYGDPTLLMTLQEAGEAARRCGKTLVLEAVRPDLYKALHIAKIAELFTRVTTPAAGSDGADGSTQPATS